MEKYEYLREDVGTTDPIEQVAMLNALGAKGWELIWIFTSPNSPSAVLFFKRCITGEKKGTHMADMMNSRGMDHAE